MQPSEDDLKGDVLRILGRGVELPDEADEAIGELYVLFLVPFFFLAPSTTDKLTKRDLLITRVRAPTADLPTTASFVGGLVAQEAIKLITKQYVPVLGYCVVDLVGSWTGVIGAAA